ncbi:MAG: hypothetical protein UR61_C0026G0008 [candidate division WS6 bacterium GW2011_GWE1_34_7]|uniref:EfeO-type cupredoxin-like domain-containing protein n=1 Tax=candidate division WS6 bacterium GW2011_GWE1_34_7 TaxID=1619093 RepID=A0A0G0DQM5_9BACT|nr:MAG: hypothetical protein UR61_C0026G0008 [candidate division WS6 bacterium GW2011_GWE1_34_7]
MKKNYITISLLFVLLLIGGSFILSKKNTPIEGSDTSKYVFLEDDVQIVKVTVNTQGYTPNSVEAKAGLKTILRMESQNSFGCERSLRIPSLEITEILPSEGTTDIDLGTPKEGENIFGSCSMGMYTFKISFK